MSMRLRLCFLEHCTWHPDNMSGFESVWDGCGHSILAFRYGVAAAWGLGMIDSLAWRGDRAISILESLQQDLEIALDDDMPVPLHH